MRFKPINLKKAFEVIWSIGLERDFVKKSSSKIYYVFSGINKYVLLSVKNVFPKQCEKEWWDSKFY